MGPSPATEADRRLAQTSKISHWSFDPLIGQINACDDSGNLVMAIPAGPMFGRRLAAAFETQPTQQTQPAPQALTPQVTAPRALPQPPVYVAHQACGNARAAA